ncbi:non-canonical purine NTP pyrophosphatase [Secundilactobacillus mixtipabuli]|uniref:Nucleoside-triphosphatase n=1 Tax=Secundilactobacillus mixtipabuli TaxID=1435342 RepID=A0A1Z5IDY5_9LACO|nr:non-canonical purine NTP pyrophosphatase [Secundilactobacillus mixtipabuli]GAW99954.1 nucleoside-triphosphatase [Secundilactobacillus mixtipabuli]
MTEWLIASNNQYKTQDLINCLAFYGLKAIPYTDKMPKLTFPAEQTDSYAMNALHKAQFLADKTGKGVIADDSGIEVPALGEHLGVTTKRELHQDVEHSDNQTILNAMKSQIDRRATMISTLVAIAPGKAPVTVVGRVSGMIATQTRGSYSTGFDKLFILPNQQHTLAELPDNSRLPLTHRGQAAKQLVAELRGV